MNPAHDQLLHSWADRIAYLKLKRSTQALTQPQNLITREIKAIQKCSREFLDLIA